MSKQAYNAVIEELKGRISGLHARRLRKPAKDQVNGGEHQEPDGDEDEYGNEPPGPEESSEDPEEEKPEQIDENKAEYPCPHCGR